MKTVKGNLVDLFLLDEIKDKYPNQKIQSNKIVKIAKINYYKKSDLMDFEYLTNLDSFLNISVFCSFFNISYQTCTYHILKNWLNYTIVKGVIFIIIDKPVINLLNHGKTIMYITNKKELKFFDGYIFFNRGGGFFAYY